MHHLGDTTYHFLTLPPLDYSLPKMRSGCHQRCQKHCHPPLLTWLSRTWQFVRQSGFGISDVRSNSSAFIFRIFNEFARCVLCCCRRGTATVLVSNVVHEHSNIMVGPMVSVSERPSWINSIYKDTKACYCTANDTHCWYLEVCPDSCTC